MSTERDKITDLLVGMPWRSRPADQVADAILAAGYRKPRTLRLWGVAFVHNGAFYKEYPTKEDSQKFADDMTEVGAHMKVVTREYVPAVYGEWEPAA